MSRFIVYTILSLLISFNYISDTEAARRALLIGNNNYQNLADLDNAVNDAVAVSAALRQIGYSTTLLKNLDRNSLKHSLYQFTSKLNSGDEVLIFYAGYGVEIEGKSLLMATDFPSVGANYQKTYFSEAIELSTIIKQIKNTGSKIGILILDTCRNNPFLESKTTKQNENSSLSRTFGGKNTDTKSNSSSTEIFVMFSTGLGESALDSLGEGETSKNSLFTRKLLPLLKKPGMTISALAKTLQKEVHELARTVSHSQIPSYYDGIIGDYYIVPKGFRFSNSNNRKQVNNEEKDKFALLIGNQNYRLNTLDLKNPHNDVTLLAATLKKVGFKVTIVKDADYAKLQIAAKKFASKLRNSGKNTVGFFYYSGHGAMDRKTNINYIIPTSVTGTSTSTLWDESVQLREVIGGLKRNAPNAIHFVVFDACRNNLTLSSSSTKSLLQSKGFAAVKAVPRMLISYSTAEGQTATDAGNGAGYYAKILSEELVKPGVEVASMFRKVQIRISQTIGQEPWITHNGLPEFYMAGK